MTTNAGSWVRDKLPSDVREALESGLPASEVWSLLLGVMEARAARRSPANLREQWARDRFVEPCYVDQRTLIAMDAELLAAASAFESIELSPVAPLGVCSAMALASQNKVVSTARGTEVVSDPTNVMALECARRLRAGGDRRDGAGSESEHHRGDNERRRGRGQPAVRLVTSHRCVRAQPFPKLPGYAAHFRLFCLVSAGYELQNRAFLSGELVEHICTQLAALDRLERRGYSFANRKLRFMVSPGNAELAERVAAAVIAGVQASSASSPDAEAGSKAPLPAEAGAGSPLQIEHHPLEQPYYDGLRFQIDVTAPNGVTLPLIDGGSFDWMRKLMSNGKTVFVASALGSQVAAYLFRTATAART